YEYGFNNFTKLELNGGSAMVPNNVKESDLTSRATEADGEVVNNYYYGDKYVGEAIPVEETPEPTEEAQEDAAEDQDTTVVDTDSAMVNNPLLDHKGFAAVVGALCGLIVLGIILIIIKLFTRRR
ncbi:MAG: hypothetical protein Q4B70_18865, partial [Lachnospiraceae bacterium]|nr:hypothetical protein [Lachnospiraceae bacterium]